MKLEKLTPTQLRALRKLMKVDGWRSAYELQESRSTLNALVRKKYAKYRMPPGSFAFPRTTEYIAIVREVRR